MLLPGLLKTLVLYCVLDFSNRLYYIHDNSDFLSDSAEERGRFVGISESIGYIITFKVLLDKSLKVVHC